MQPKRADDIIRHYRAKHGVVTGWQPDALHTVLGEPGVAGLILVLLAIGVGLLLDFWIFNLHPVFSVGLSLLGVPLAQYWTIRRTLRMTRGRSPNPDYMRNLALATVAGQSGCMTVILVFAGMFAGMFLDARLDTHPVFTIGLILVAIPVSLYSMIRLLLSSVAAIRDPQTESSRAASDGPADNALTKENGS